MQHATIMVCSCRRGLAVRLTAVNRVSMEFPGFHVLRHRLCCSRVSLVDLFWSPCESGAASWSSAASRRRLEELFPSNNDPAGSDSGRATHMHGHSHDLPDGLCPRSVPGRGPLRSAAHCCSRSWLVMSPGRHGNSRQGQGGFLHCLIE